MPVLCPIARSTSPRLDVRIPTGTDELQGVLHDVKALVVPTYDSCVKVEDNFPKKIIGETYYHFIVGRECTKARNAAIVSFRRMLTTAQKLYRMGAAKRDLPQPAVKFMHLCDGKVSALQCKKRIDNFLSKAMDKPPVRLPQAPKLPGSQLSKWVVDGKAGLSSAEQLKAARTRAKNLAASKRQSPVRRTATKPPSSAGGCKTHPKWEKHCRQLAKALAKAHFEDKAFRNQGKSSKFKVTYGHSCYTGSLYSRVCPNVCNTCPPPTPAPGAPASPPPSDPSCQHGRRCDNAALRASGQMGSVCVLASCGACGAEGLCDGFRGGSKGCCVKTIQDAGRSCSGNVAPCMIERRYLSKVPMLDEGQEIEARWRGTGDWLPGVILRVANDGTYAVRFDSGEEESEVARNRLRPVKHKVRAFKFKLPILRTVSPTAGPTGKPTPAPPTPVPTTALEQTAAEEVKEQLGDLGIIAQTSGANSHDSSSMMTSDMDSVRLVDREHGGTAKEALSDVVRDEVAKDRKELKATAVRKAFEKRHKARLRAKKVAAEKRKAARAAAARAKRRQAREHGAKAEEGRKKEEERERASMLVLRTPVEANMGGEGTWYRGTVMGRSVADLTYTIQYQDGESETKVPAASVIARGTAPKTAAPTPKPTTAPPTPVPTHKYVDLNPKTSKFADDDDGSDDSAGKQKAKQYTTINGLTTKEVQREEHVQKEQVVNGVGPSDTEEAGMQFYAERAMHHGK